MRSFLQSILGGRFRRMMIGRIAIIFLVLLILIVVAPWLSFIEVRALDLLFALRPSRPQDSRIEVVDVGEDCDVYERLRDPREAREGGCEIPRLVYAEATRRLHRWGAKIIVFDLMFRRKCLNEDERLAKAFRQAGNVIVAASAKAEPGAVGLQDPVTPLDKAVLGVGSPVAHQPNEAIRSMPLVVRDRDSGREYQALSLLAYQHFKGVDLSEARLSGKNYLVAAGERIPILSGEEIHLLTVGGENEPSEKDTRAIAAVGLIEGNDVKEIPRLKTWNTLLVNWRGPQGTFRPRQLSDLLGMDDKEGRELFAGKAVIIGQLDWDAHWTAVGAMPGPEVQANALYTLISGDFIRPISPWGMLGIVGIFSLASVSAAQRLKGIRAAGILLLLLAAGIIFARQLLQAKGLWIYLFYCELAIGLAWGITVVGESGKVSSLLARFVPSFIGKPGTAELGKVRSIYASILFSDIRGYTGTAEQLSAEDTLSMLNAYHSSVEDIITKYGGTIVKTPGDAILAVFWREMQNLNHMTCAVNAGKEILQGLPVMGQVWEAAGVSLDVGVGINVGQVAIGLVGKHHLEPTVIGDPVNVAQRLETLTKTLGYPLIFSESVREGLREETGAVFLNEVEVRGRKTPLKIYGLGGKENGVEQNTKYP